MKVLILAATLLLPPADADAKAVLAVSITSTPSVRTARGR